MRKTVKIKFPFNLILYLKTEISRKFYFIIFLTIKLTAFFLQLKIIILNFLRIFDYANYMDIRKIVRLHKLIKNQRTGSPKELAEKIGVSERSVYNYIGYMKIELNAPISYEEEKRSYCYEYDCDFNLDGFNFC